MMVLSLLVLSTTACFVSADFEVRHIFLYNKWLLFTSPQVDTCFFYEKFSYFLKDNFYFQVLKVLFFNKGKYKSTYLYLLVV